MLYKIYPSGKLVQLALSAASISLYPMIAAADVPMCHDMPMRQSTLDSGNTYLKENGGSRNYERLFGETLSNGAVEANSVSVDTPKFPVQKLPKSGHFNSTQYNYINSSEISDALVGAATLEAAGRYKEANGIYEKILRFSPIGVLDKVRRALAIEGAIRTKILMSAQPQTETGGLSKSDWQVVFSDVARHRSEYAAIEKSIVNSSLSQNELDEAAAKLAEALAVSDHAAGEFTLAQIDDKRNKTAAATERIIKFAKTNPNYSDRVVPFFERHPQMAVLHKTELEEIMPKATTEFQIMVYRLVYGKLLSNREQLNLVGLLERLPALSEQLSPRALQYLIKNCPTGKRPLVTAYLEKSWLNNQAFENQYKPALDEMRNQGWTRQRTILLTTYPKTSAENCFFVAVNLARYCADKHEPALYLDQLTCALASLKTNYRDFKRQSEDAKTLRLLIEQHPDLQAGTASIEKEALRCERDSNEQMRRRQCLEMASQLNETAFKLEKRALYQKAGELYQSSLEIKQINLDKTDPEIASQMIDVARVLSEEKKYTDAEKLFRQAINLLKTSRHTDPNELQAALQSYGQALNAMNQPFRAEVIYKQARQLAKSG